MPAGVRAVRAPASPAQSPDGSPRTHGAQPVAVLRLALRPGGRFGRGAQPPSERADPMTIKGKAYIAGIYEHPTRKADDKSLAQLHAEVARGALAIAAGKCNVALITLAGRPRAEGMATGTAPRSYGAATPDGPFESPFGPTVVNQYAMAAMRHMYQFGTTSEQLAWVKVAASHHAQHNPHAMLREVVTVDDVVGSPLIADPLHRLDCCVISDGGGAIADDAAVERSEEHTS